MIDLKGHRHEQGIQQECHDGAHRGGIPDPPGGEHVPQEKSRVDVPEYGVFPVILLVSADCIFDIKKRNQPDEKQRRKAFLRPGERQQDSSEEGEEEKMKFLKY